MNETETRTNGVVKDEESLVGTTTIPSTESLSLSSSTSSSPSLLLSSSSSLSPSPFSSFSSSLSSMMKNLLKHEDIWKLLFAASGIYGAFLYYGSLQEDVFRFVAPDGSKFHYAWFLQVFEALSNTIVGYIGRNYVAGPTPGLKSIRPFMVSGISQVFSKAFTSLALASGLSFPVATLAKSGKMAPVMIGQLILGGAYYSVRDYLQVAAIIFGTVLLSMGKKKGGGGNDDNDGPSSTTLGVVFIVLSLIMDGCTAGIQKRLKVQMMKEIGKSPKPYDFMFFTNLSMTMIAFTISLLWNGDFIGGYSFVREHAEIRTYIIHFCICSAIGQSFIFYTVSHFDPLVCTTITTTRKIISVLISIIFKGHVLAQQGWMGVSIASGGLLSEIHQKFTASASNNKKQQQQQRQI